MSYEFQSALAEEHRRLGQVTEYSRDNFAYGSTPFHSWLKLHTSCEELSAAVHSCTKDGGPLQYVVFGSSLGWLVFYAAFTLRVDAVGYEIVAPIVRAAQQLADQHGPTLGCGSASFHCQDMLSAPLDRCGVLFLTSRCWDKPLSDKLHAHLIARLPMSAVVVDYCDDLARAHFSAVKGERGFVVVGRCVVPVSWDNNCTMFVMRRCAA